MSDRWRAYDLVCTVGNRSRGRCDDGHGDPIPPRASPNSQLLPLRSALQTYSPASHGMLDVLPLAPGVAWHPGYRQGIPRIAYWCRSVSATALKLRSEATSLPGELPAAVLKRLDAEGISTCEQWLTLGATRSQIFGITRAKVAQIDAAVARTLRT